MEAFDVLNEAGEPTGKVKARAAVHRDGDWHRTVHCWLYKEGQILLQFRGPEQEANPGLWDISCAGHISAGEDMWLGAEREVEEELGVKVSRSEMQHLGTCKGEFLDAGLIDREFSEIFLILWKGAWDAFAPCPKEVSGLNWMTILNFKEELKRSPDKFVSHPEEYELLFKALEKIG